MTRRQQPALTLFAVGMIGLGILALVYGDFALVWQPVAAWVPGRTALAYASGVIMLLGGAGLLFSATAKWSVRILFPYLIIWLLLKVPALVVAPQIEAVWLGVGELAVLLAGGWTLFAVLAEVQERSILQFATGENGVRIAPRPFCSFSNTNWAFAPLLCEGDGCPGASVASLSNRLGLFDRRRTYRKRCRPAVIDLSAICRGGRSGNVEPVYAAGLGPRNFCCTEDAIAVDSVLHLMGNHGCRMGGCQEHGNEGIC